MRRLAQILALLERLWRWLFGQPKLYRACHVSDPPDTLEEGILYIVGADGYDWSALMQCPGGCKKTLEMNLLPAATPVWQVTEDSTGIATLRPSVWLKTDCKCHFILRDGKIRWV